jgi:hypothetical protein
MQLPLVTAIPGSSSWLHGLVGPCGLDLDCASTDKTLTAGIAQHPIDPFAA